MLAKDSVRSSPVIAIDVAKYGRLIVATVHLWLQRRREREELARMTELELKDFGLAPSDRHSLLRAPFWRRHPFAEESKPGSACTP